MVTEMVKGESEQLLAMVNFIKENHLDSALRSQNWEAFAHGYNGSDFKKNKYDERLAATHAKYKVMLRDIALRAAQTVLFYVGFNPGTVDGVINKHTRAPVTDFHSKFGLPQTGNLDPATEKNCSMRLSKALLQDS